jgi:hypothetical protein
VDYVEEEVAGLGGIWVEEEEGDEGGHEGEQDLVGPQLACWRWSLHPPMWPPSPRRRRPRELAVKL